MNILYKGTLPSQMLPISFICSLLAAPVWAAEITYGTDSYNVGDTLTAGDLNAKFNELKESVNDNNYNIGIDGTNIDLNTSDIDALSTQIDNISNSISTLESNYPIVAYSGRFNSSNSPEVFNEINHKLIVTNTGGSNSFIVESNTAIFISIVIADNTGATSGTNSSIGATLTRNISGNEIATIDLSEFESPNDTLYRYRCMSINKTNLVTCTQERY